MAESGWKIATDKILAAAERGMKKAVSAFEADTKALTHVDTGHLRRNWTHDVRGEGDNIIVDVAFKGIGIKSLSAKFAPMEII